MSKVIYLAGGGQKSPAWLNVIEKKLQHKLKHVSTSPAYGVILMINDNIKK